MVNDAVLDYIYYKTNSRKEYFQIIIHVWLFLGAKLCKFNVLHNSSSSQQKKNSGVILNPNIYM